ncbi:MAG: hypothetical protein RL417_2253, partial [Pseudomonadota bacterium]
MEGKQTKIFREILSVPAIEESLL